MTSWTSYKCVMDVQFRWCFQGIILWKSAISEICQRARNYLQNLSKDKKLSSKCVKGKEIIFKICQRTRNYLQNLSKDKKLSSKSSKEKKLSSKSVKGQEIIFKIIRDMFIGYWLKSIFWIQKQFFECLSYMKNNENSKIFRNRRGHYSEYLAINQSWYIM